METLTRRQMIINEIAARKAEKAAKDYLKNNCLGRTIKHAVNVLFGDEFFNLYYEWKKVSGQNDPQQKSIEVSNELMDIIHEHLLFITFNDVFKSVEAHSNIWNCKHHGYDCDYILTEKDLKPSWEEPPIPKMFERYKRKKHY